MFSFEGDFVRKPDQTFGVPKPKTDKETILKKNQEERQKREETRQKTFATIKIQSFYRACVIRKNTKDNIRKLFDDEFLIFKKNQQNANFELILQLLRKLIFFYQFETDKDRLFSTNGLCIYLKMFKTEIASRLVRDNQIHLLIKKSLALCTECLTKISMTSESISTPMRLLEIFCDYHLYERFCTDSKNTLILHEILNYLLNHGYFKAMKNLLKYRVPNSIHKSAKAPTPIAEAIFESIKITLTLLNSSSDIISYGFCFNFVKEFLMDDSLTQIENFFIPALTTCELFHFEKFIDKFYYFLRNKSSNFDLKSKTLIYNILLLSNGKLFGFNQFSLQCYVNLLHLFAEPLMHSLRGSINNIRNDFDSDSEMETNIIEMQSKCMLILNNKEHVEKISTLSTETNNEEIILSICCICDALFGSLYRPDFVHKSKLLYTLAFQVKFLRKLWKFCQNISVDGYFGTNSLIKLVSTANQNLNMLDINRIVPVLSLFCSLFSHYLLSLHDSEFYNGTDTIMPFTLKELIYMTAKLRDVSLGVIELVYPDVKPIMLNRSDHGKNITENDLENRKLSWSRLFRSVIMLSQHLHARDSRHRFCPSEHWLAPKHIRITADSIQQTVYDNHSIVFATRPFGGLNDMLDTVNSNKDNQICLSSNQIRQIAVLTQLPFVLPFDERVRIFRRLIATEKKQEAYDLPIHVSTKIIRVRIRRNYLYEDAYENLNRLNCASLKPRLAVQMINAAGLDEAGIDGGGIFRDFLWELIKTAFDPNRGLFTSTPDGLICPNPFSKCLMLDFKEHFHFIGRSLGKVLYDNMLVDLPLAHFFLAKILGRTTDLDINHLASLDPELYKNLMSFKKYDGDVSELGLDMTITNAPLPGTTEVIELKQGGKDEAVTNNNRIEYMHLVADYRLNRQIKEECLAFRKGLEDVIPLSWLRMFDEHELNVLISGAQVPIDVDDLRINTVYGGGYDDTDKVIQIFWSIVADDLTDNQRRLLLKFVTSVSRPPLLGFKELHPKFCIHRSAEDRLPTASTCMNLLKLPDCNDRNELYKKLVVAIESNAGFELS